MQRIGTCRRRHADRPVRIRGSPRDCHSSSGIAGIQPGQKVSRCRRWSRAKGARQRPGKVGVDTEGRDINEAAACWSYRAFISRVVLIERRDQSTLDHIARAGSINQPASAADRHGARTAIVLESAAGHNRRCAGGRDDCTSIGCISQLDGVVAETRGAVDSDRAATDRNSVIERYDALACVACGVVASADTGNLNAAAGAGNGGDAPAVVVSEGDAVTGAAQRAASTHDGQRAAIGIHGRVLAYRDTPAVAPTAAIAGDRNRAAIAVDRRVQVYENTSVVAGSARGAVQRHSPADTTAIAGVENRAFSVNTVAVISRAAAIASNGKRPATRADGAIGPV